VEIAKRGDVSFNKQQGYEKLLMTPRPLFCREDQTYQEMLLVKGVKKMWQIAQKCGLQQDYLGYYSLYRIDNKTACARAERLWKSRADRPVGQFSRFCMARALSVCFRCPAVLRFVSESRKAK
jgi:hypothetical protein